jgi:hypothetical protein
MTFAVLIVLSGVAAAGGGAAVPTASLADRAPDPAEDYAGEIDSQEPPDLPEQWRQTYGADGDDIFADLVRTEDGGYLLVGWTERETTEGWVLKIDGEGERVWERTLGGAGTDRFWGVATTDNGYLLAGRTDAEGATSGWVLELDSDGEVREERVAGSGAFNAIERDESGDDAGYLLAGWTTDDGGAGLALKLDEDGAREWQRSYSTPDGYGSGYLRAIVPVEAEDDDAGGYYLAGTAEGDSADAWALKVDSEGNFEWQRTVGSPNRDEAWAAAPASNATDGGFVLAGETGVDTSDRAGLLVKFDADGSVAWERTPGDGALWFDSAMRTEDGYLFTGSGDGGPTGTTEGYVLRTSNDGTAQWDAYYGTQGWDKPWPAVRAHGDGYLLAGQTSGDDATAKDGWLVRIGTDSGATGTAKSAEEAESEGTSGETADSAASATTTDSAMRDGTTGAENPTGGEGGVPGMGVGAALLALVALLLLMRG